MHPINMIGMSTEFFEQKYMKKEKSVGSREETTTKAESPNLLNAVTHIGHTLSETNVSQTQEKSNRPNMPEGEYTSSASQISAPSPRGEGSGGGVPRSSRPTADVRDVDGFGNNFEKEVIYPRGTSFVVTEVGTDNNGRPYIKVKEIKANGQMDATTEEQSEILQQVQTEEEFYSDVREISERNTSRSSDTKNSVQGVRADKVSNSGEVVQDEYFRRAKLKSREVRILEALARITGTRIRFVETINEGKDNAEYANGEIRIALDSEDPVRVAVVHEVIHRLREISPESYSKLASFVFNNLTADELELLRKDFGIGYRELSPDGLSEEIVAQAFGVIMGDKNRLDALIRDDRRTWEKICDIINDLIISIRRALSGEKAAQISEYDREAFSGLLKKAEEMERVLREALETAEMQKYAQKSTAGAVSEGIKFSRKGSAEELSIKQQMKEHLDELNDMEIVVSITGKGIDGRNKTRLKQDIINVLKPTGYQVDRKGFGKILFTEKEIKGALNYLGTDAEIAAFKALPRVLKRGLIVGEHKNHKVCGYDTVTIAAPIQLNGKRAVMAVVVKVETNNEYKLHRIVSPDGGRFEYMKKRDAEPTHGSVLNSRKNEQNLPISSASNTSISETEGNVNSKSSRKRNEEERGRIYELERENERQRELIEHLRGQMKRRVPGEVDTKAVKRTARELIRRYGGTIAPDEISPKIKALYDDIGTGKVIDYDEIRRRASELALEIAESAVERDDTMYQEYSELRKFCREEKTISF